MPKTYLSATLIVIALLPISRTISAEAERAVGEKDGLQLIVSQVIIPDPPQSAFECRLHNLSDQEIPFDLSTRDFRLSFRAVDEKRKDILMTPEGAREYDWKRVEHMRHCSATIAPGQDRVFTFYPVRAYGDRWKSAAHLLVSWEPGIDWSTEKPYTKGRGLTVSYEIPKEDHHISAAPPVPLAAQASNSSTNPTQVPQNTQPSAQAPLTVIVGLFISGLALLWLVRMRRSKMRGTASNSTHDS